MINNRYIIKRKLGEGRSKVFSAIDTEFPDKEIAIKFLPVNAKPDEKDFFREEFFRIKKFDHPNIIKAFEFGTVVTKDAEDLQIEFGSDFITLEYFPSKELLAYTELIDERKLKQILTQLCAVLYYLHQSNYIYYDLKPENILVNTNGNNPQIKLIDFGLAEYQLTELNIEVRGTAHYIAPELLKREHHDHTVDLYSLGILLYRIVYGRFPFSAENEVDIYKAQIEQQFIFPPSRYSRELISVIKKLLNKDASLRYHNSFQVLEDLGIEINLEITKDLLPAKFFSNRKDAVNIIRTYLADLKNNEIYCVKGAEGSGKTSLFIEIYENFENAILIENFSAKSGIDAVKYIFKKIFYSKVLFENYSRELLQELPLLFDNEKEEFVQKIKVFADSALKNSNPIILIDDFNLYDEFVKDVLKEVLPVFQINNTKVIISENSNFNSFTNLFANISEFQISHFTDSQLADFIEISYWQNFPKRELKKIIGLYSDLLPGNVKQFIKDLIVLGILKYSGKEISFSVSEELEIALRSSNEEIYRIRLSNLSADELKLAQLISAFEIGIEQMVLAGLLGINSDKIKELIDGLEKKNIIYSLNLSNTPRINSASFKSYIYSTISSKTKYHLVIANTIKKLFPNFNTIELARQYELAGEFEKSAEALKREIETAEKISAFAYKKSLLEKVLAFNLSENTKQEFLIELIRTNYKLSDYKSVIEIFDKIKIEKLDEELRNELKFMAGVSYKNIQSFDTATKIFNELFERGDIKLRNRILFEFADLEFDLRNFEKVIHYIEEIKKNFELLDSEDKGRLLNLQGLVEYNWNKNIDMAIKFINEAINEFENNSSFGKLAGIYANLGILFYEIGDKENSNTCISEALELNKKLGNYEQQAKILMNQGVMLLEDHKFEEAINLFRNSKVLFRVQNNKFLEGLCNSNLGEAYLYSCDYQNAYESLIEAQEKFSLVGNVDEELRVLFLLGKFWFIIGDVYELEKIINQFEYYSYTKSFLTEEHSTTYEFLKFMLQILNDDRIPVDHVINLLRRVDENNINLSGDLFFILLERFCNNNRINDALYIIKEPVFGKLSNANNYLAAYSDFINGLIVRNEKIEGMNSPLEYFELAYSKLENESITELTWKVLVAITEMYLERGNYHRAKKPRLYALELINLLADSISNPRIRVKFLEKKERKNALDILKKLNDKVKENELQQN
ncbi:Serine/threonine protein kinase [Ignavibacterium album JCM 16511]|uniref:Serine/threonine protein kinase n=1 Tax=Ignavibacterium album (strain DSM 19864 / JCM 16511 / NBRC 101810 / Mat9-16) TaxID=945713 RepID=I0AGJ1_IGNAJ|nr:serine/threonine-protein kinase [Ignavibacterium album]AFH48098.1 Serine/threonine protein kinase [Ignavibacterium album JCM 16511]